MTDKSEKSWTGAAVAAGAAAIGSAALAAALLYAKSRKDKARPTAPPARPEDAPETD
ncbi:MAG: hypothetical protein KGM17_14690 [Sphingomonadales bacterium]|nr:hypothetical protein [Sphingomonadales bacterium]